MLGMRDGRFGDICLEDEGRRTTNSKPDSLMLKSCLKNPRARSESNRAQTHFYQGEVPEERQSLSLCQWQTRQLTLTNRGPRSWNTFIPAPQFTDKETEAWSSNEAFYTAQQFS